MATALIVAVPLQALARRRGWAIQHEIQMRFCRAMCAIIGIRVDAQGALPGRAPRFVVANHISWTDIIALSSLHPFVFLAKSEVARWPALGFLARLQGTVFINRHSRNEVARVNDSLAGVLRAGRDLVVFPEATSTDGTQVLPFKPTHFEPVASLDPAPMLAPLALRYTNRAGEDVDVGWYGDMTFLPHLWSMMRRNGDIVCCVAFSKGIDPCGADRKMLAAKAEEEVRALRAPAPCHAASRSDPPKYSR